MKKGTKKSVKKSYYTKKGRKSGMKAKNLKSFWASRMQELGAK
jgi:hypothetical protein